MFRFLIIISLIFTSCTITQENAWQYDTGTLCAMTGPGWAETAKGEKNIMREEIRRRGYDCVGGRLYVLNEPAEENNEQNNNNNEEEKIKKSEIDEDTKLYYLGIGTAFFINNEGYFISNSHVVKSEQCYDHSAGHPSENKLYPIEILARDTVNDLLVGKINKKNNAFLNLSNEIFLGEDIIVAGYPLSLQINSKTIKVNKGIISSISGVDNNYSDIQFDAPIQPGNSGSPVLNQYGGLVAIAKSSITTAQNTNFAVKSSILKIFLESNGIKFYNNENKKTKSTIELSKKLDATTIQIFCYNTKTVWRKILPNELISSNASLLLE